MVGFKNLQKALGWPQRGDLVQNVAVVVQNTLFKFYIENLLHNNRLKLANKHLPLTVFVLPFLPCKLPGLSHTCWWWYSGASACHMTSSLQENLCRSIMESTYVFSKSPVVYLKCIIPPCSSGSGRTCSLETGHSDSKKHNLQLSHLKPICHKSGLSYTFWWLLYHHHSVEY